MTNTTFQNNQQFLSDWTFAMLIWLHPYICCTIKDSLVQNAQQHRNSQAVYVTAFLHHKNYRIWKVQSEFLFLFHMKSVSFCKERECGDKLLQHSKGSTEQLLYIPPLNFITLNMWKIPVLWFVPVLTCRDCQCPLSFVL